MAGELEQRAVVDDVAGLGVLADHRGLHAVVEDLLRHAAERLEGGGVAAQQGRQVLVHHEAAPQHPAVPEHQREQPDDAPDARLVGEHRFGNGRSRPAPAAPGGVSKRTSKGGGTVGRMSRSKSVTAV